MEPWYFDVFGLSIGGILLLTFFFVKKKYSNFFLIVPSFFVFSFFSKALKIWTFFGLGMIVLSLLNIRFFYPSIEQSQNLAIQIIVDVSLSMSADDIAPQRFEVLKSELSSMIVQLTGYRISVILFSGIPFEWIPWSSDIALIAEKIKRIELSDIPPTQEFVGTAIGDALLLASHSLDKQKSLSGVILLFTDGDSNKGYNPEQLFGLFASKHIPIYTFGIGNSDYLIGKGYDETPINTIINLELIRNLATYTSGAFYHVTDRDNMYTSIQNVLNTIYHKPLLGVKYNVIYLNRYIYIVLFWWFLVGLICILGVYGWQFYKKR